MDTQDLNTKNSKTFLSIAEKHHMQMNMENIHGLKESTRCQFSQINL